MPSEKIAVVLNSNSVLGVTVLRKLCKKGFKVLSIAAKDDAYFALQFAYINPEFNHLVKTILVDKADLNDPKLIISKYLSNFQFIDQIVSLNATHELFVKWDIDLIEELFVENYIDSKSTVIIGRDTQEKIYSTNKSLEIAVQNLGKLLTPGGVTFKNLIEVEPIVHREDYVAETLTKDVFGATFKYDKFLSFIGLLNSVTFHFMPAIFLNFALSIRNYITEPKYV